MFTELVFGTVFWDYSKIPFRENSKEGGKILSWILIVFMIVNIAMSSLALNRYTQRHNEEPVVHTKMGAFFDEHFPD